MTHLGRLANRPWTIGLCPALEFMFPSLCYDQFYYALYTTALESVIPGHNLDQFYHLVPLYKSLRLLAVWYWVMVIVCTPSAFISETLAPCNVVPVVPMLQRPIHFVLSKAHSSHIFQAFGVSLSLSLYGALPIIFILITNYMISVSCLFNVSEPLQPVSS